jgi:hypothetical protein
MPILQNKSWKSFSIGNDILDKSIDQLDQIKMSTGPDIPFKDSFFEISKNQGVSFLSLDPSESQLQLFHHGLILGGSWSSPSRQLITLLGTEIESKPIQIVQKSIQDFKSKSFSTEDFALALEQDGTFASLKTPKVTFHYKNIVPIPNFLTKIFFEIENKDPTQVATAFFHAMYLHDSNQDTTTIESNNNAPDLLSEHNEEETNESMENIAGTSNKITISSTNIMKHGFLEDFIHVKQFCHLCAIKKMPPVLYTIATDTEALLWYESTLLRCGLITKSSGK